MGILKTFFDLKTVGFRPALQARITDELLFDMPQINAEPVIILGATRATALLVDAAVKAGHKRFFIVGGKPVGDEAPAFTKLLNESLEKSGLPQPSNPDLKEHEYGHEVLYRHFGVPANRIMTRSFDTSTNMEQNMGIILEAGYVNRFDSMEMYTLAGTARRAIGTARKVWNNSTMPLAVHNVYPEGVTRDNWMDHPASRFFAVSEADKILPSFDGYPASYERKGFCRPVNVQAEIAMVNAHKEWYDRNGFGGMRAASPVSQP